MKRLLHYSVIVLAIFLTGCTDQFVPKLKKTPIAYLTTDYGKVSAPSGYTFEKILKKSEAVKDIEWQGDGAGENEVSSTVCVKLILDPNYLEPKETANKISQAAIFLAYRVSNPRMSNTVIYQGSEGLMERKNGQTLSFRVQHDELIYQLVNKETIDIHKVIGVNKIF